MMSRSIQDVRKDLACSSWGATCDWCVFSICRWIVGWPIPVTTHPMIRNMKRHGMRCEAMNMNPAVANVKRKRVEESPSSEKFVGGVRTVRTLSCSREKSSMLF